MTVRQLNRVCHMAAMSFHDWKDHFGSSWSLFCETKRRYDRGKTLTPGNNVL
jgi:hypothetical protein